MIHDAEDRLNKARENAANDIFARMNSVGDMGREQGIEGELKIDFHGLHLAEAKHELTEFVLPILQSMKRIVIVTGSAEAGGDCPRAARGRSVGAAGWQ